VAQGYPEDTLKWLKIVRYRVPRKGKYDGNQATRIGKAGKLDAVGNVPDGYDGFLFIKRAGDRGKAVIVVLSGARRDEQDDVQAARFIKDEFPEIAIVILTDNLNDTYLIDTIQAGSEGYILLNNMIPGKLMQSIRQVVKVGVQMETELQRILRKKHFDFNSNN
jgi:DNA-binding NarL/FixJ family response regulator